jgi:glucose/arabinose dehydrogenase
MEVIATGVRNTQGFDWHPVTRELVLAPLDGRRQRKTV